MAHITIAIAMPEMLILPLDEATWQVMRALCTQTSTELSQKEDLHCVLTSNCSYQNISGDDSALFLSIMNFY